MRRFHLLAAISILGAMASPAAAQLVTNGSFETGNFSGWTTSNLNATSVQPSGFDGYVPQDGSYFAALGNVGSDGIISQTVSTTAGANYVLSYYLASNGTSSDFSVDWNGTLIPGSAVFSPDSGGSYIPYQFLVTGTGSDTLTFNERDDPSYMALDNVSLVPSEQGAVPEPATWAMMLLGFAGMGMVIRRRSKPVLAQLA